MAESAAAPNLGGRPRTIDPDRVSLVALRLFDTRGFDRVSMDEIAAVVGISRRSLFRLFPTKSSLVWGGLEEFSERMLAALTGADPAWTSAYALRSALRTASAFDPAEWEVTRRRLHVISENTALRRESATLSADLASEIVRVLSEREGVARDELAIVVLANAFAATVFAALSWWAAHGPDAMGSAEVERPEDVVDRALATLLGERHR